MIELSGTPLVDMEHFFSESVYNETPKEPSLFSIFLQISPFLGIINGIFSFFLNLSPAFAHVGDIIKLIFPRIFPMTKSRSIKHSTAGRIFTYFSISTIVYGVIVWMVFSILIERNRESLSYQGELAVATIVIFILTIVFFTIKESVFEHYCCKLIALEKEKLEQDKRTLIERIHEGLDAFSSGNIVHVSMLSKEIQLMEEKITHIDEKMKEVEREIKFHKSSGMTILFSLILISVAALLGYKG